LIKNLLKKELCFLSKNRSTSIGGTKNNPDGLETVLKPLNGQEGVLKQFLRATGLVLQTGVRLSTRRF
jgi:hypothetical protein